MSINFFAIIDKIQSLQKQSVSKKYTPLLRISHSIVPPEKLNYNEFCNYVNKQTKL